MLHIMTPLYRYELLEKIYKSIPKYDDIIWHIAKTSHREKLINEFINTDPRIKLYEIDCLDTDIVTKRNTVFENIKDGYFYLLDDDTIFLEELYKVYKEYSAINFIGMIVGNQINNSLKNNIRKAIYPTIDPKYTLIDTGMVLCHSVVLEKVKWDWSNEYFRDCYFWSRCFRYFGKDSTLLINREISIYNYFGVLIRVRKKILFLHIKYDICNPRMAKIYTIGSRILDFFRPSLNIEKRQKF